ncbi:MAG: hypothetical protein FJ123_21230 [Deltaproteobacteria bacterium]|nr:hypothetical protein [Deltaproteobacteria bacterium]
MLEEFKMGTGCRVFLVEDDDSIQRISMARVRRLLNFDRRESLPQYAGKRVRCAIVFVEVVRKQVLAIQDIQYSILTFDTKGRIDKKEWEKGMRLGMDLLPPFLKEQYPRQVIDAHHRFAKRRYEHEFKWKPSRKLDEAVVAAVFS